MVQAFLIVVGVAVVVFILLVIWAVCWAAGEMSRVEERWRVEELGFVDKKLKK